MDSKGTRALHSTRPHRGRHLRQVGSVESVCRLIVLGSRLVRHDRVRRYHPIDDERKAVGHLHYDRDKGMLPPRQPWHNHISRLACTHNMVVLHGCPPARTYAHTSARTHARRHTRTHTHTLACAWMCDRCPSAINRCTLHSCTPTAHRSWHRTTRRLWRTNPSSNSLPATAGCTGCPPTSRHFS